MTRFFIILDLFLLFTSIGRTSFAAGFVVQNQIEVSVTVSSTQFLPSNTSRHYLLVINNGTNSVVLKFGSVQSASEGVLIPSGGNYELNGPIPVDAVFMKSASGTQLVTLIEG